MEYEYNICELLEQMRNGKDEQKRIVQDMANAKKEYDAKMEVLKNDFSKTSARIFEIGTTQFPVRLGDLVEEICWLSKTNVEDVKVSMHSNCTIAGVYGMDKFLKMIGTRPKFCVQFMLSNRDYVAIEEDSSRFNYSNVLMFDLNSLQSDGTNLIDHCSIVVKKGLHEREFTQLVIDKDIEDVIIPLDLNYISLESSANWIPADLFTQAVINTVSKYNDNTKTLRRKK